MSEPANGDPVLTLIQRIKNKQLHPRTLSAEDRRRCVEVLRAEGYGLAEIGQILQYNERTIRRDLEMVRAEHALSPDAQLAERFIGNLVREAETSMAHLRRIARETKASAMERLMAETSAWKVCRELFEKLQSVGYLPKVPTSVVADVYQHLEADPIASYDELADRLGELKRLDQETGENDPQRLDRMRTLLDEVQRGRVAAQVDRLTNDPSIKTKDENDERA
ncbi:MAG: helix-turn-helix domain-containing protein [Phycisphaerales bacterium]|nr:helix-turn-helix domain-containing protein [Phycisphaerales bacterium]